MNSHDEHVVGTIFRELVIVKTPHVAEGAIPEYHEWIPGGRFKGDSLGRRNPRVIYSTWWQWTCNNPECPGWGIISEQAVGVLFDAVAVVTAR